MGAFGVHRRASENAWFGVGFVVFRALQADLAKVLLNMDVEYWET